MDEKGNHAPDAPSADESCSLLPQYSADIKSDAPHSAPAAVNAPNTPPARSSAAAAASRENQLVGFIQRLVPGYIPVLRSHEPIRPEPSSAPATASTWPDAEAQRILIIQCLDPYHLPVTTTAESRMGHATVSSVSWTGAVTRMLVGIAFFCIVLTAASGGDLLASNGSGDLRQTASTGAETQAVAQKRLVPLEAHIMSKCPDTKACLKELVVPAMERISQKVDFTLSFLGRPTANDGVECMHGAPECLGNILLLCAAHYYPTPLSLPFAMCLENDYKNIPNEELVRQCALEHAVDFDKLNECASDQDTALGLKLLRDSVERSTTLQVRKSCTVRLANQVYCIHDGDWKECPKGPGVNDLVLEIEKLYNNQNF